MEFNCKGLTDIGLKRDTNQDFVSVTEPDGKNLLMIVCDGMGGAAGGSEASSIAATVFAESVKDNIENAQSFGQMLVEATNEANTAVCNKAESFRELDGMGTTIAAALFDGENYTCVWVGDSRIYAITDSGIKQISHDHSFVQSLVDSGSITPEEAKVHPNRNIITKAVGTGRELSCDVCVINASEIKGILICSDGLCGYVEENDIADVCLTEADTEKCAEKLVGMANAAGGADNITVIVQRKQ